MAPTFSKTIMTDHLTKSLYISTQSLKQHIGISR